METKFKLPKINYLKNIQINYSQPFEISNFSIGINIIDIEERII